MLARYAALGPWRGVEKWLAGALLTAMVLWMAPSCSGFGANMVVPVVMAVSVRVGADPVGLGLAATAACTFGFMLPVSTPTNAMAFATGYVTQRQMIRYGVVLDCLGLLLLSLWFGWVVR